MRPYADKMAARVTTEEAIARVIRGVEPPLIGIDGLPCSGKSTLVNRLRHHTDIDCMYLDDFVVPETDWPTRNEPAFPFQFIRYNDFLDAIRTLAVTGRCAYFPFDWEKLTISTVQRIIRLTKPVIVEGVSTLHPDICHLYGLRIFVESDRATTLTAAIGRGVGAWEKEWRELFLPSADIYMTTQPADRADLVVAGRGAS